MDAIFTLARDVQLKIMPITSFKTKCYQILVSKLLQSYFDYCGVVWDDCSKIRATKRCTIQQYGLLLGLITLSDHQMYVKLIFSSAHFLIGVQWLGTNCQIKQFG